MDPGRGKRFALLLAALAFAALIASAFAFREQIATEYRLFRLSYSTGERQEELVAQVAAMGPGIVPRLLRGMEDAWKRTPDGELTVEDDGKIVTGTGAVYVRVLLKLGKDALPEVIKGLKDSAPLGAIMALRMCFDFEKDPEVEEALAGKFYVREDLAKLLRALSAAKGESPAAREAAAETLRRLEGKPN